MGLLVQTVVGSIVCFLQRILYVILYKLLKAVSNSLDFFWGKGLPGQKSLDSTNNESIFISLI